MSRLSLNRTGNRQYREYLDSPQWAKRRREWFQDCRAAGYQPVCQVCEVELEVAGSLDLHHASYDGVKQDEQGRWQANETDAELMPMCRLCHSELHRRMDARRAFTGWSRRRATVYIAGEMRRQLKRERQKR